MSSNSLTVLCIIVSLAIGGFISYKIFDGTIDDFISIILYIGFALAIGLLCLFVIYFILGTVESETITNHKGVIVNRIIKGESQEDNVNIINGVPYTTTSTTPEAWILKVRDNETNEIMSIDITEEQFYNETRLVVGATVDYEKEYGNLTGNEDYSLK